MSKVSAIDLLADNTKSQFALLLQGTLLNERMTAIQSALLMVGYDVYGKN